jgi:type I restriction enzyme, S subunit
VKASTQPKWPTSRLRFLLNPGPTHDQREKLRQATQVTFLPMEAIGEQGELDLSTIRNLDEVKTGYTQFFDGAVIVAKITPCFENGKGALVQDLLNGVGFGTTELYVLSPGPELDGRFLYYITKSSSFKRLGEAAMTGAAGQKRVPEEFVRNFRVGLPSLLQQHAMADFLDRETAKIDALIVAKERLLGILTEKRRALITHAVTRGLNPDAPLCDSGFSWLGQIPADWNVIKLKHIAAISYGFGDELDKSLTSGVPLISLPNVSIDGALDLTDLGWADLTESEKSTLLLKRGDLLFNWRNGSSQHLAKTAYFDADGDHTHVGFLLRIRFDLNKFEALFYQAFLNALRVTGFFLYSRAMVNNTFNQTELANLPVVVPPIAEQRTIVSHIKKETAKMDAMRDATEKTIGLLKERRAALIAAAVTGQIDV